MNMIDTFADNAPCAETLALRLAQAHEQGDLSRINALFRQLKATVAPILKREARHYLGKYPESEMAAAADAILWDAVVPYATLQRRKPGQCPFAAFLSLRLSKGLKKAHWGNISQSHGGAGPKLLIKLAQVRDGAALAGVNTNDSQAILDHAVAQGHRRSILSRNMAILAGGTLSLDAPFRNHDGDSAGSLIDFVSETLPQPDEDENDAQFHHRHRELRNQVHLLKGKQRDTVIRLFGLDGRPAVTIAQLAREEGVTASSVAGRIKGAMETLRTTLRPKLRLAA